MKKLISAVRSIFANELAIHVSRDLVTVRWDGHAKVIRPVVHVSAQGPQPRVVGVDEMFGTVERTHPVQLFGPLPPDVSASTWLECLDVFIAYALANARARVVATRPVIRLHGVAALGDLPVGPAGPVLTSALLRAGAHGCTVED